MSIEKRGRMMFGFWSKFVLKKGGPWDPAREFRLKLFKYYLFSGVFLLSPFISLISWCTQKIFYKKTKGGLTGLLFTGENNIESNILDRNRTDHLTMPNEVYITRLAKFLPNRPVTNDDMEKYLGQVDGRPSKAKAIVLRNNKIKTRYYALDENGRLTHTNAQMTAEAVRGLLDNRFTVEDIELLSCGTSSQDQLMPSHASMVHGELGGKPIEINSPTGACVCGMQAMKYAYLAVLSGEKSNAVCTGSELMSTWMRARNFEKETEKLSRLDQQPIVAFEKDFLRWMLSDGAGAALLQNKPNREGPFSQDRLD